MFPMFPSFFTSRRGRARGAAVTLAAAAALFTSAAPALAHDELVSSNPAAGAAVAQPPTEVVLTFDEAVLPVGTQVVVTAPDGPASNGSPQLDGKVVRQPVRSGPAGQYSVAWRATSADGHPISGTFTYTAQAAASTTTSAPVTTTAPPSTTSSTSPATPPSTTPATSPSATTVTAAPAAGSSSGSPWLWVVVVLVLVALGLGGWAWSRRRTPSDPGAT